jgi:hypothetical protein
VYHKASGTESTMKYEKYGDNKNLMKAQKLRLMK